MPIIADYAKKGAGSLLVFIHSHGDIEGYFGSDFGDVSISDTLAAANTKEMDGKAKCFFLSMCRKSDNHFKISPSFIEPWKCTFVYSNGSCSSDNEIFHSWWSLINISRLMTVLSICFKEYVYIILINYFWNHIKLLMWITSLKALVGQTWKGVLLNHQQRTTWSVMHAWVSNPATAKRPEKFSTLMCL